MRRIDILGIIILNYNSYTQTIECIESILNTTKVCYKIIVVDNNSTDKSGKKLMKNFSNNKNIEVVLSDINCGYAAGNNIGVRYAIKQGAEVIVISNSDVIFKDNTLNHIADYYKKNDDASVVAPKLLDTDGSDSTAFITDINFWNYYFNKLLPKSIVNESKRKTARVKQVKNKIQFQGMPSGSCFAIRSKLFEEIGFFDENTFMYYEESILAAKLRKVNNESTILLDVEAIHKHVKSNENYQSPIGAISVCHSLLYYLRKYKKINKIQAYAIYIPHLIRFYIRSKRNNKYREKFDYFIEKCEALL